ncbi:hypothetical protein [Klebsiella pneumoniae]
MSEEKTLTGRIASHPGFAVLCTPAGVVLTSFLAGWEYISRLLSVKNLPAYLGLIQMKEY